jgi:arylsulfatase A-like enzyme
VSQYDANLFYADKVVGVLLDGLRAAHLDDRTVVVVTADHGEAFGEHGRYMHNTTLYQEMAHIPFVVHFPPGMGVRHARVPSLMSLVDVLPTLRALFAFTGDRTPDDGRSLVPALLGRGADDAPRPCSCMPAPQVAVVEGRYKYIYDAKSGHGSRHSRSSTTCRTIRERSTNLSASRFVDGDVFADRSRRSSWASRWPTWGWKRRPSSSPPT